MNGAAAPEPAVPRTSSSPSPNAAGAGTPGGLRLFGFHHAGGSTSAFAGWQRALAGQVEVIPVRLPGRDRTAVAPDYRDITSLAAALHESLGPQLDEPHVFYGHSMGALVAYHLTRLRVAGGHRPPRRLMVGAFRAPHLPQVLDRVRELGDEELARWLLTLSDLPDDLLSGSRRTHHVALLRRDLGLCASHRPEQPPQPLPCPIDAIVGARDPLVAVADAAAWSVHTDRGGSLNVLPGGHFFNREAKERLFASLTPLLRLAGAE